MLNIKWAAYRQEQGTTQKTLSAFNVVQPDTVLSSGRIDTLFGEIGGPATSLGDEDSDQWSGNEVEDSIHSSESSAEIHAEVGPNEWQVADTAPLAVGPSHA